MLLSILCLNGFSSVNYNFEHFIQYISDNKLKSYYFTLNESKIDLSEWIRNMVRIALSLMPESLQSQLILLSIDDTMVEKYGEHFVSVPEQGGGKLIPEGLSNPGQVYTISPSHSGMIGVFRLESQMLPGTGKLERTGIGSDSKSKEAANTAFRAC